MSKEYLFGFDCGTYESKGVLCDLDGNIIATASAKHTLKVPKPGYAEHDPINDWWNDFKKVLNELIKISGIRTDQIAGIGISAIMAAITPVDENCNPLRNAILYGIDTRCQKQADQINKEIGRERLLEVCGSECSVESFGPKIRWIAENEPDIYRKARHFTIGPGFLVAKLTGNYCVDDYSAIFAHPMINYRTMNWDDDLCGLICEKERLPKIGKATDIAGTVTKEAASETGLREGTPVNYGTTDAAAEAVSVGVIEPGDMMIMYGSTIFMNNISDRYLTNSELWSGVYLFKNTYSVTSGMATTGSLTRWIRDNFAKDLVDKELQLGENSYNALFAEAENIPAGSDGLIILPYFSGERMPIKDPNAKGVIMGLNLSHTRGHIMRAALEGVGYGLAQNLELYRKAGCSLDNITAVGGGTKSKLWMQIISDICGINQRIPEVTIGASYGDAILAGLAIGAIESVKEVKKLSRTKYITTPNKEVEDIYKKYRKIYEDLYQQTKNIMHSL